LCELSKERKELRKFRKMRELETLETLEINIKRSVDTKISEKKR
jgi:hypothetical protein